MKTKIIKLVALVVAILVSASVSAQESSFLERMLKNDTSLKPETKEAVRKGIEALKGAKITDLAAAEKLEAEAAGAEKYAATAPADRATNARQDAAAMKVAAKILRGGGSSPTVATTPTKPTLTPVETLKRALRGNDAWSPEATAAINQGIIALEGGKPANCETTAEQLAVECFAIEGLVTKNDWTHLGLVNGTRPAESALANAKEDLVAFKAAIKAVEEAKAKMTVEFSSTSTADQAAYIAKLRGTVPPAPSVAVAPVVTAPLVPAPPVVSASKPAVKKQLTRPKAPAPPAPKPTGTGHDGEVAKAPPAPATK